MALSIEERRARQRAANARYYARNRDKVREYQRNYRAQDPEKWRSYAREYARRYRTTSEGKAYRVKANRKYNTGFTQERWDASLVEQNGLCAICRLFAATEADHNHDTKEPRGILCGPCNRGLGQFHDNPERLTAAISYLRKWTTNG